MKSTSLLCLLCSLALAVLAQAQGEQYATIKATTKFLEGGFKSTTVVDPDARTAVETLLDSKNKVRKKVTYLLDEKNFALGAIHYDEKGNVRYKETYARDVAGHVVEAKFTTEDGRPLGKRIFNFNGNKFVGGVDYDANGQAMIQNQRIMTTRPAVRR